MNAPVRPSQNLRNSQAMNPNLSRNKQILHSAAQIYPNMHRNNAMYPNSGPRSEPQIHQSRHHVDHNDGSNDGYDNAREEEDLTDQFDGYNVNQQPSINLNQMNRPMNRPFTGQQYHNAGDNNSRFNRPSQQNQQSRNRGGNPHDRPNNNPVNRPNNPVNRPNNPVNRPMDRPGDRPLRRQPPGSSSVPRRHNFNRNDRPGNFRRNSNHRNSPDYHHNGPGNHHNGPGNHNNGHDSFNGHDQYFGDLGHLFNDQGWDNHGEPDLWEQHDHWI